MGATPPTGARAGLVVKIGCLASNFHAVKSPRIYTSGPEIDLVVQHGSRLRGFEIKRTSSPTLTRSMRSAMDDLGLSRLDVIHAGEHSFPLAEHVHAIAGARILDDL